MKVSGTMPDVTPAQVIAFVQWIVAQAVAYGWLDTRFSQIVLSAASTIVAFAWTWADAHIRNGRAKAVAANPSIVNTPPTSG